MRSLTEDRAGTARQQLPDGAGVFSTIGYQQEERLGEAVVYDISESGFAIIVPRTPDIVIGSEVAGTLRLAGDEMVVRAVLRHQARTVDGRRRIGFQITWMTDHAWERFRYALRRLPPF